MHDLNILINKLSSRLRYCGKPGLFLLITFSVKDMAAFYNECTMQFRIEYIYRSTGRITV